MSKYLINTNQGLSEKNSVYDLCGVVNHIGQSLSVGHYTAVTRTHDRCDTTKDEICWRLFDDQDVSTVQNEGQIVSKNAYVLMYRLRNQSEDEVQEIVQEIVQETVAEINESSSSEDENEFYDIESGESVEMDEKESFTNLYEID